MGPFVTRGIQVSLETRESDEPLLNLTDQDNLTSQTADSSETNAASGPIKALARSGLCKYIRLVVAII